jgi:hypothetical protein
MRNKFQFLLLAGLTLYALLTSATGFAAADHLKNTAQGQCLHTNTDANSVANNCLADEPKQTWTYNASARQLVNANGKCLTARSRNSAVSLSACQSGNAQVWVYDASQRYKNSQTGQCLNVNNGALNGRVRVINCGTANSQKWQFVTVTPPPPQAVNWLQHDLKLNGIGVGVESASKVLLVSLDDGFDSPASYDATFTYGLSDTGYSLAINGTPITNGSTFHFNSIQYGASIPLQRYLNGVLADTYTLVFTNLPVIQLKAADIVDEPKLPGTFRLMSAKFNQDTGVQNMGIEYRGNTAQLYPKKPYSIQIGTATDWATSLDVKLLDMRNDSDWILDAAYRDQIVVRNIVSHDIFRALRPAAYVDQAGVAKGQSAIRGYLAEVIQNETYQGTYILEEKPDRKLYNLKKITVPTDANGVAQWSQVDFSNPENGSVLYKADNGDNVFYDAATVPENFEQAYPKPTDVVRWEPLIEFAHFVATASDAEFIAGIGNRIDIDSVVDWWLLVDSSVARDNIKKNFYMAKSGSGKFFMATWDHDASFGMDWEGLYDWNSMTTLFIKPVVGDYTENNLIRRLTELPATGFNAKLKVRWTTLRASVFDQATIAARFEGYLNQAVKGGAKARNLARWPGTGGAGAEDSRLGTVDYIKGILDSRLPLLDQAINSLPEN